MKTARLIIGIITIVVSIVALMYAIGAAQLDIDGEVSGLFIGIVTLAAGVICIAARHNKRGGYVSGGLCFLAAIIGFFEADSNTELLFFSIYNLLICGVLIIGSLYSQDEKTDSTTTRKTTHNTALRGKSDSMKTTFAIMGIVLSIVLFVLGCFAEPPDRRIWSYDDDYVEYVGGDAYNLIIEASLRAGEIAGARSARAIYFSSAAILMVLSGVFLGEAQTEEVRNVKRQKDQDEAD